MNPYLLVFLGGGLGSIARFGLSKLIAPRPEGINPVATFAANLLATLILGLIMYRFGQKMPISPQWKSFLATGFCGGFSTFSTFGYETMRLAQHGQWAWAVANVAVSMGAALGILWLLVQWGKP